MIWVNCFQNSSNKKNTVLVLGLCGKSVFCCPSFKNRPSKSPSTWGLGLSNFFESKQIIEYRTGMQQNMFVFNYEIQAATRLEVSRGILGKGVDTFLKNL